MSYLRYFLSLGTILLVFAAAPARSEGRCKIGEIAEFPVTVTGLTPLIPVKFNGSDAHLVVDSGAFYSLLSPAGAAKLKLSPNSAGVGVAGLKPSSGIVKFRIVGPDGEFVPETASVKQFIIADVPTTNVQFLVGGSAPTAGAAGFLGQNVLGIADIEYDLAHGVIRLLQPQGCGQAPLVYWAASATKPLPYSLIDIDPGAKPRPIHTVGHALLNGTKIRIVFDTGAPTSMLTLAAARRAGIRPDSPGVVPAGPTSWIGRFASFTIDTEEMHNVRLRFGNFSMDEGDMLLGADFFLSHRIYVANSQDKLYLTYNGGPPFDVTSPSSNAKAGLLSIRLDQSVDQLPYFNPGCNCGTGMPPGM